jgi:uncharacterized membrane protein YoaK (UPF0700 family)
VSEQRAQAASVLLLALAAGSVDAISFIVLHHIFTANMTGNTTKLGIAAGKANGPAALPLAVAVAVFIAAIVLATALIEFAARRGFRATAAPMLMLEAALVAALMLDAPHVLRHNTAPDHTTGGFYTLLTLAILAMGTQTASLTKAFGRTIRTTYVSGLLTTFSQELLNAITPPPRDRASYLRDELGLGTRTQSLARLTLHLAVWTAFLGGAIWGGYGERRWSTWPLALPLAAILAAGAVDLIRPLHRTAGTNQP